MAGAVHASFTDMALLADQIGIDIGAALSGRAGWSTLMITLPGARAGRWARKAAARSASPKTAETAGRSCWLLTSAASSRQLATIGLDHEVHVTDVIAPAVIPVGLFGDGDQDPAAAQHRPRTGHDLAADWVDHNVDIVDMILEPAGVIEDVISAKPGDELGVPGGRRGGYPGAVERRELDSVDADAAGATMDQDMLPRLQPRVLVQGLPGRKCTQRNGGGLGMADAGRLGRQVRSRRGDVLGRGAGTVKGDEAIHLITRPPAGDPAACFRHYAGQVVAGDGRPALRPAELASSDSGGMNFYQHLSRPWIRDRDGFAGQAGWIGAGGTHGRHGAG